MRLPIRLLVQKHVLGTTDSLARATRVPRSDAAGAQSGSQRRGLVPR
jgi:hypothetical protein